MSTELGTKLVKLYEVFDVKKMKDFDEKLDEHERNGRLKNGHTKLLDFN